MTDQRTNGRILADPADASTGDLVKLAAEQISRLVRDELQLARVEIGGKAKRFGTGAGLFGAAGVIALYGVATLVATVILLLALVLPAWAAALIVAAVLLWWVKASSARRRRRHPSRRWTASRLTCTR